MADNPQIPDPRVFRGTDATGYSAPKPAPSISAPAPVPDPPQAPQSSLLSAEERQQFTAKAITQQNTADEETQKRFSALAEKVKRGFGWSPAIAKNYQPAEALPTGPATISRAQAVNSLPIAMRGDWNGKRDFVISNYPTLYKAAQDANLSPSETTDVVNITLAVDAAMRIGRTVNPNRQQQLLESMPRPQQALVIDVLNAISDDQKALQEDVRKAQNAGKNAPQSPVLDAAQKWFWNPSVTIPGLQAAFPDLNVGPIQNGELYFGAKGALDTLVDANEYAVRGANALQLSGLGTNGSIANAWEATQAGSFDPQVLANIRKHYDPVLVDVMLTFKKLKSQNLDSNEAMSRILDKYKDNPAALQAFDQITFNTDPTSDISKLSAEIDLAETSNIANVTMWSMGAMFGMNANDYQDVQTLADSMAARIGQKVGNVALPVLLDPTLGVARLGKGVKLARYGLAKMAPGGLEQVFDKPAVARHFNTLGAQLESVREMPSIADQAQRIETIASQYKNYYTYDAIKTMFDAGIKDAASAKTFFKDGDAMETLVSGQAGLKRGTEWTVPHMTQANAVWKSVMFKVRGLNPANMGGPRAFVDALFGEGTADVMPEDAAQALIKTIEDDPMMAGRAMSDWAYTDTGGVQRTLVGKIISPDTEEYAMRNRYGWRRKGLATGDLGWFADRLGRLMARMPDTRGGIVVSDGSSAGTVKQVAQSLGMSRYFSNVLKFMWSEIDEPTRVRLINGINRSAIYASGVDLVDPQLARSLDEAFAVASRTGTQYTADQVDVLAIRAMAEKNVDALNASLKAEQRAAERQAAIEAETEDLLSRAAAGDLTPEEQAQALFKEKTPKGLSPEERGRMIREQVRTQFEEALNKGDIHNPSSVNATDNYALYDSQLTSRVSIFDAAKMTQIMARQSFLNALLGGGSKMTTVTDLWTLATLAGPRFVMRSGLEDFGLYALTNGKLFGHGGWMDSRRASQAIRESIMRAPSQQLIRGNNPGMKLGLATTARRELGTALARRVPLMRGLILPYLDPAEVRAATEAALAKGSEATREPLANLMATAYARARFFSWNRVRYALGQPLKFNERERQVADWIKDGVSRGHLNSNMDRASEVTEHLADGTAPALRLGPQGSELLDGVTINYDRVGIENFWKDRLVREDVLGYKTAWKGPVRNHDDVERLYTELGRSMYESGSKGYAAIALSQKYYRLRMALLKAVKPETVEKRTQALDDFVTDFADSIADDPNLSRYVLVNELGVEGFTKRLLDDALRMMTTADGRYNKRLLEAMRLPNHREITIDAGLAEQAGLEYRPIAENGAIVTVNQAEFDALYRIAPDDVRAMLDSVGRPISTYGRRGNELERRFGLFYFDDEGKFHYNLSVDDLHNPEIPMPQSVGHADTITVPVSDKIPFTSGVWSRMGRALARLTREPIYISNYVDVRKAVQPWRDNMVSSLTKSGKSEAEAIDMADEWASKFAADKAYDLTMSYVDNPEIRSQLAWQVRNVARFYRALEDFNRRMMRVAQNKPDTFWKLALGWNVLEDSGFVWTDEYGDKYFMFPGTQAAFGAMNGIFSLLGIQQRVPTLPMTWGARVTMLSPSTDPNALVPTLGSPYSSFAFKSLIRLLPSLGLMSNTSEKSLEGAIFGEYSPQQTLAASLLSDIAGPNLKRISDLYTATYGGEASRDAQTDTAIAVAAKQAIHALAASGLYDPKKQYTDEEIRELKYIADTTAVNALWLKLVLTPNLPATPQNVFMDVSDEARQIGIDSGDALFLTYLNKYPTYGDALIAFTKDNPGKAIYAVSKYENTAFYQSNLETQNFIEKNMDEFKARPVGLSHFAPVEGTYGGLASFYFMRANGIKVPKTVETYFNETMQAAGQAEMDWIDTQADQVRVGASPEMLRTIDKTVTEAKKQVLDRFPLAEYQKKSSDEIQQSAQRQVQEISQTARFMVSSGQDSDGRAAKYLDAYNVYLQARNAQDNAPIGDAGKKYRSGVTEVWKLYISNQALPQFAGDDRGTRYLRLLSQALNITKIEGL